MSNELITIKKSVQVLKASESLGLVFGMPVVSLQKNASGEFEPYVDLHDDYIPEDELVKMCKSFIESGSNMYGMHDTDQVIGSIPFVFPGTSEIMKNLGFSDFEQTGIMTAAQPQPEYLNKFLGSDPEWTGFSVGIRCKRTPM